MKKTASLLLGLTLLAAAACGRGGASKLESNEAVEAAIRAYLSQRSDLAMDKMVLEIEHVEFKGEKAEADVVFRAKDGQGAMPFHYTLRRERDHWVVERGAGRGMGTGTMPPGHPPVTSPPRPEKIPRSGQP